MVTAQRHTCHAHGCPVVVPPKRLMCKPHWCLVPKPLQKGVWDNYRAGQENDKKPTAEYLKAAKTAIMSVKRQEYGQNVKWSDVPIS